MSFATDLYIKNILWMNNSIGRNTLEFIDNFLTPEEIVESEVKVALIGERIKERRNTNVIRKRNARII